jgi:chemotaxis signal transduction protein
MYPDTSPKGAQLFQFMVPGFPALPLAIAMQEVLEVADLPEITPIPFAPRFILGISKWRDTIVTVVDLALKLCESVPARQDTPSLSRCLIAQVALGKQLDVVAWPILPQAGAVAVPPRVFKAEPASGLFAPMVHTTVMLADQSVTVLNLEGMMTP